ncbi:MAG: hypothetical protein SF069_03010 [Phycisphaerae bacterium]|nr:hypothetical protein [Phycisphaerae bacterium]
MTTPENTTQAAASSSDSSVASLTPATSSATEEVRTADATKAKKAGRPRWTDKLTQSQMHELQRRIADAGLTARAIYAQLNLARYATLRAVTTYVGEARRGSAAKAMQNAESRMQKEDTACPTTQPGTSDASLSSACSADSRRSDRSALLPSERALDLLHDTLLSMQTAIAAGLVKPGQLASYLDSSLRYQKLLLDRDVNARAAEMHAAKMAKVREAMHAAVAASEKPELTREAVYDLIDQAMRGQ